MRMPRIFSMSFLQMRLFCMTFRNRKLSQMVSSSHVLMRPKGIASFLLLFYGLEGEMARDGFRCRSTKSGLASKPLRGRKM